MSFVICDSSSIFLALKSDVIFFLSKVSAVTPLFARNVMSCDDFLFPSLSKSVMILADFSLFSFSAMVSNDLPEMSRIFLKPSDSNASLSFFPSTIIVSSVFFISSSILLSLSDSNIII